MRDIACSEALGGLLRLTGMQSALWHITSDGSGTTTQTRHTIRMQLPQSVLAAIEERLAQLPRQTAESPAAPVGAEAFVGDDVGRELQARLRPSIVYFDGRPASRCA